MSNQLIEAVTVCVDYSDFLKETIKFNQQHFDRWVIVTSSTDTNTRELCRKHNLPCIVSDDHLREGDSFNKGRLIARGIDQLSQRGWLIHLDADIVLPRMFRQALDIAHLDPTCLYGADRVMVKGKEEWQKILSSGYLQHDYHYRVNFPAGYDVGTRWASWQHGWCPIGYFQMWHGSASLWRGIHAKPYPVHHADAARGDVQFSLQWDRRKRVLLPEVIVFHLESVKDARLGANWKGRTTPRFDDGTTYQGKSKRPGSNDKPVS